jgi:hypothetical protein
MTELDERLRALARADAGAEAPPRVEAALRARLRVRRVRRWPVVTGLLAAAGALVWALVPGPSPPPLVGDLRGEPDRLPRFARSPGGFLPLFAHAPEIEDGQIVRMQVPAGLMTSLGWPLPAEDDHPRTADVLFGEDGVARAIRFVPVSFRTGR